MKSTLNIFRYSACLALVGLLSLTACNKKLTQADVADELEEAREATAEAQEETAEAVEAREQYYADAKETQLEELNDRMDDIDDRIKDLRKNMKKAENKSAIANMKNAIDDFEDEKKGVKRRMAEVEAMEAKDWSASYDEINQAVSRIEAELNKLSNSLGGQ